MEPKRVTYLVHNNRIAVMQIDISVLGCSSALVPVDILNRRKWKSCVLPLSVSFSPVLLLPHRCHDLKVLESPPGDLHSHCDPLENRVEWSIGDHRPRHRPCKYGIRELHTGDLSWCNTPSCTSGTAEVVCRLEYCSLCCSCSCLRANDSQSIADCGRIDDSVRILSSVIPFCIFQDWSMTNNELDKFDDAFL